MRQYLTIKQKHPDKVVAFRLGDFYEMFMSDAVEISKLLQLTLTNRQDIPMCGIPHHASANYFRKIIRAGKKIAIAEQVEEPAEGKTLIERKVTRVITPGTTIEESELDQQKNNYLVHLFSPDKKLSFISVAAADISTGEIECFAVSTQDLDQDLRNILCLYQPREILIPDFWEKTSIYSSLEKTGLIINAIPRYVYEPEKSTSLVKEIYRLSSLRALGESHLSILPQLLGGMLHYLKENHLSTLGHLRFPRIVDPSRVMLLDQATITNLELVENIRDRTHSYSLFEIIKATQTAMGTRLLRQYLLKPLVDIEAIRRRQDKVKHLYDHPLALSRIIEQLKGIFDIERLLSKIALGRVLPREILTLKNSLKASIGLMDAVAKEPGPLSAFEAADEIREVIDRIGKTLMDTPSNQVQEGGYIRDDVDPRLKRYREANTQGVNWILRLLEEEKLKTGIGNLKIKYTESAGYFFEVTRSQIDNVPEHFVKKQAMMNASRYTSEKLLQYQDEILSAKEKATEIEIEIYTELKEFLKKQIGQLQKLVAFCSEIDVCQSFATKALSAGYICPEIKEKREIHIKDGRHPVVEAMPSMEFIPNNLNLGGHEKSFIHLITGPNMGGKSTFLRQTALIVLLAQIGSFVPAKEANIGICDRIFIRIGASDNLARGESTFLTEMSEAAYILSQATPRSLIIMDELGRGTSTYDGMSLAWSIIQYLRSQASLQCRTLFATHYHELTDMDEFPEIENFSVSVSDIENHLVFHKKVVPGAADQSYGVHVAELAGLPPSVIESARRKLVELESSPPHSSSPEDRGQMLLLSESKSEVEKALRDFDLDGATPMEAMKFLHALKEKLN